MKITKFKVVSCFAEDLLYHAIGKDIILIYNKKTLNIFRDGFLKRPESKKKENRSGDICSELVYGSLNLIKIVFFSQPDLS